MRRILFALPCLAITAYACAESTPPEPTKKKQSAVGVCADACPDACSTDADCDTDVGDVCCTFGKDAKACVDQYQCPQFCHGDGDCSVSDGQACFRTMLESGKAVCTEPTEALTFCQDDSTCNGGTCCTLYKEPVCVAKGHCPSGCVDDTQCNAGVGELCCTTLPYVDSSLGVPGVCIQPVFEACPKWCQSSSECNVMGGETCCDGICRTDCVKECKSSSDCSGQLCCKTGAIQSPWFKGGRPPGYRAAGGVGGGSSGSASTTSSSGSNTGAGGSTGDCMSCAQFITDCVASWAPECDRTPICSASQAIYDELANCVCAECASECPAACAGQPGGDDFDCSDCQQTSVATSCGGPFRDCSNDI
jgi:hypothetical protein